MEFELSEKQQRLKAELAPFLSQQKSQGKIKGLSTDEFARELWRGMAEKGWLGLNLPRKYGGAERPYLDTAIFTEELHYQRAPEVVRTWFDINFGIVATIINKYGSQELKSRFLTPLCQGKLAFSACSTDAEGGSDIAGIKTNAREENGYFIVNGTKIYNESQRNDWTCVFLRTGTYQSREKGLGVLLIDLKTPGISLRPLPFIWGLARAELSFQDVKVPRENLVGEKNRGWDYIIGGISGDWRTIGNPGQLQRDLERFVEVAKKIKYDGQPVTNVVTVKNRLTELFTELEIMRYLYYHAFWVLDNGLPGVVEAGMARTYGGECWQRFYNALIEMSGRYGLLYYSPYTRKFPAVDLMLPVQYAFAPAMPLGGWPVETVRSFIAKEKLGLPTEIADYKL